MKSISRPITRPAYEYDLPETPEQSFSFTATVDVQPEVEVADWTKLQVPAAEVEVPEELVDEQVGRLQLAVAELAPADRAAVEGDVLTIDLDGPQGSQKDYVVEVGDPRFIDEVNAALLGMSAGETTHVEWEDADGPQEFDVTVKDVKERILPPLDDELARAASEFDTLTELRADLESRIREQIEEEVETQFRAAAADALVDASNVQPSGPLVDARTADLLTGLVRSLESRGISPETYLAVSNQTPQQLEERLRAEAARSVARELALEAVAEKAGLEVDDEELRAFIREHADAEGDEAEEVVNSVFASGRHELLREDLRMRKALDRLAADVERIPVDLARAREKLWTPEKGAAASETKLWTPGSKEPE